MAASTEQTLILQMTLGLFDAAPGAVFLTEFEALYKASNNSIASVANALSGHTVFKGLYPDSLSNIEFGKKFIERLIGTEANDSAKGWAASWVAGQLDLGQSRALVMLKTSDALLKIGASDSVWGKANQAFNNKVKAAEYFSIETKQSSTNLTDLQKIIDDTTSDNSTIPVTPLKLLIANHAQAVKARDTFLVTADGDDDSATSATKETLTGALDSAFSAVDVLVEGDYASQSAVIKAALLKDQQAVHTELETFYKAATVKAKEALDVVAGLASALATREVDAAAHKDEQKAVVTTNTTLLTVLSDYGTKNTAAPTINADGTITGLIVLNGVNLVLENGITDTTNPGIDALLAASIAKEAADAKVLVSKPKAQSSADAVDNLDLTTAAKVALAVLGGKFTKGTPANVATPTTAEITQEVTALATGKTDADDLVVSYTAASVLATTADAVTDNSANSTTNLVAIKAAFNGAAGVVSADQARVTATTTDAGALTEIAIIVAETTATATATQTAQTAFNSAKTSYDTAADSNPLVDALLKAQEKETGATKAITDLSAVLVKQKAAQDNLDKLAALEAAVTAAKKAFTDIGLTVPEVISGSAAGTDARDIWLAGNSDAAISSFNDKDSLYLGTGYTLNSATTAGANSADSLLELWLTDNSGSTLITLESSMTGGSASPQETFAITVTGVALTDMQLVDGMVTLV